MADRTPGIYPGTDRERMPRRACLSCGRPTDNAHTCDDCERAAADRLDQDADPERCDACGALDPCDCTVTLS